MLLWEAGMNCSAARTALAIFLATTSANPSAKINPLGVVTQAKDAVLGGSDLSAGTSIFDGNQLSTGTEGALSFRSGTATVFVSQDSVITLHGAPEGTETPAAELVSGTLVFSTTRVADMAVNADSARIRAAANLPTIGQIRTLGPRTLQVYARRGELIFSYGEESERIGEGEAYRIVLLAPAGDDDANKPGESDRGPAPSRRRRGFLLFLVGAAAVGALWHHFADLESPDRP
jgi:hypothetical protein